MQTVCWLYWYYDYIHRSVSLSVQTVCCIDTMPHNTTHNNVKNAQIRLLLMRVWLECRGKVDMEHTSVSPSSFIYTRTKPGIHQRKYYTYKYTTMTSYKLWTIILTSLSTQKYTKNQQQPQTGAMHKTPCYVQEPWMKHTATCMIAGKQSHDHKYAHRLSVHSVLLSTTVQQCHIQLKNRDALSK